MEIEELVDNIVFDECKRDPRIDTDEPIVTERFLVDRDGDVKLTGVTEKQLKALNLANSSMVNKRKESDFYPTPPEVTQALLNTGLIPKQRLWEPACGEGHMSEVLKKHSSSVLSTDLRATGYTGRGLPLDFLSGKSCYPQGFIEGIVTNPPFNLSTEFLVTAMSHKPKVIALLLKSQYWHSQKRAALFEKYPPAYVMALTWRPDFCFGDRGGAPTMECIWTVWIEGETDTRYRLLRKPV